MKTATMKSKKRSKISKAIHIHTQSHKSHTHNMAVTLKFALMLLVILTCIQVKKSAFVTSDTVGLSIEGKEISSGNESFISSSLWQLKRGGRSMQLRNSTRSYITLLILLCGDVESCPGPTSAQIGGGERIIDELMSLLKVKGLKILHQNTRGLLSNFAYISELFQSFKGIDILTLSETHIDEQDGLEPDSYYDIPGYSFISRPRKSGKGGGVGAYISDGLIWDRRLDLENEKIEVVWLEIRPKCSKGILIASVYRPPDSSKHLDKDFNELFNSMLTKAMSESKETILLGDMNANFLDNKDNKDLKSIFNVHGLKQMIRQPTRITESTESLIDIILTNKPVNLVQSEVIPTSIGDHEMIGCARKLNSNHYNARLISCRDYKNYNLESLKTDLRKINWMPFYNESNVNDAWLLLKSTLTNLYNRHAPIIKKNVRGKPAPWLNEGIKSIMNERDQLLRKSRRTKSNADSLAYKRKRNETNIAIKRAKSSYYKNLLSENSENPSKFWKVLKSIYPCKNLKKHNSQSFDIDGEVKSCNPSTIANAFGEFFAGTVKTLKEKAFPLCAFVWRTTASMSVRTDLKFKFQAVSKFEVERNLKSIKRSKATGLDDLPPGLLKDSAELIAAPLTHLVNLSLVTNIFPADWKNAKIIPVYKSGTHSNLDNYRPISILPVLSKIIEKIVHRQLMSFLDKNSLLSEFQFGFRRGLSTELATTLLLDDIRREVDSGKLVGAVFIDLSKAFDTISHAKLLDKLSRYGINDGELEWFKDYLFSRKAVVSYNNCLSEVHEIYSGVPQGSILGPLLFLVFFNDITDVVNHSKVIKYADDTVLYVADKQTQSIQAKLDKDMESIAGWLKENELIINLKKGKTESLLFGTAKRRSMQTEPLEVSVPCPTRTTITSTSDYKYLGVHVDH